MPEAGLDQGRAVLGGAEPERRVGHGLGVVERRVDLDDVGLGGRGQAGLLQRAAGGPPQGEQLDQVALGAADAVTHAVGVGHRGPATYVRGGPARPGGPPGEDDRAHALGDRARVELADRPGQQAGGEHVGDRVRGTDLGQRVGRRVGEIALGHLRPHLRVVAPALHHPGGPQRAHRHRGQAGVAFVDGVEDRVEHGRHAARLGHPLHRDDQRGGAVPGLEQIHGRVGGGDPGGPAGVDPQAPLADRAGRGQEALVRTVLPGQRVRGEPAHHHVDVAVRQAGVVQRCADGRVHQFRG